MDARCSSVAIFKIFSLQGRARDHEHGKAVAVDAVLDRQLCALSTIFGGLSISAIHPR
jgi:hypothetical protein